MMLTAGVTKSSEPLISAVDCHMLWWTFVNQMSLETFRWRCHCFPDLLDSFSLWESIRKVNTCRILRLSFESSLLINISVMPFGAINCTCLIYQYDTQDTKTIRNSHFNSRLGKQKSHYRCIIIIMWYTLLWFLWCESSRADRMKSLLPFVYWNNASQMTKKKR